VYYWPIQILGHNLGTQVCIEGKMFSAQEAFNIKWVNGVANDVSDLMTIANKKAEELIKIPCN
jgi:enoyl-CoA hydratase/carnithine racemase